MKTARIPLGLALITLCGCSQKASEAPPPPPPALAPAPAAPAAAAAAPQTAAAPLPAVPAGARVWFIAPVDGAKVEGPLENGKVRVDVKMGADGIAIKPAGAVEAGSGHHHILIDAPALPAGTVVPKDEQHLHFGTGQTEAALELAPGEHTLQLQLADGAHRSYGPALSATIKISVVAAGSVGGTPPAPATKAKP